MQLQDFKYEQKRTKESLVLQDGVYLATRRQDGFTVLLFAVHSFYVEVYCDLDEAMVGYIRAFSSVDELAPYLSMMDISELLSSIS